MDQHNPGIAGQQFEIIPFFHMVLHSQLLQCHTLINHGFSLCLCLQKEWQMK